MVEDVNPDLFFNKANFVVFTMLADHPEGLTLRELHVRHQVPNAEVDYAVVVLQRAGAVFRTYPGDCESKYYAREGGVDAFTRFTIYVEEWRNQRRRRGDERG